MCFQDRLTAPPGFHDLLPSPFRGPPGGTGRGRYDPCSAAWEAHVDVFRGGGGVPLHGLGSEENPVFTGERARPIFSSLSAIGVRRVEEGDAQVVGPAEGPLGPAKDMDDGYGPRIEFETETPVVPKENISWSQYSFSLTVSGISPQIAVTTPRTGRGEMTHRSLRL